MFGYVSISKEADIKLQILLGNTPFCMAAKVRVLQKMKKKDLEWANMGKISGESNLLMNMLHLI